MVVVILNVRPSEEWALSFGNTVLGQSCLECSIDEISVETKVSSRATVPRFHKWFLIEMHNRNS